MYTESPKVSGFFHEAKVKSPQERNGEVENEKDFLILFQGLLFQQCLEPDANLKNYCAPQEELALPNHMIGFGGEENIGKDIGNILSWELSQAGKKFMPGILGGTGLSGAGISTEETGVLPAAGISAEETGVPSAGISTEETGMPPAAGTSTELKVEMNMGSGKESTAFREQSENPVIIRQSLPAVDESMRQGRGDTMPSEDGSGATAQGKGLKEQKVTGKVTVQAIESERNLADKLTTPLDKKQANQTAVPNQPVEPENILSIYRTLTDVAERTSLERLPAKIQSLLSEVENSHRPKTLELKLEPETLGTVRVTINWTKGEISARFFAQSESAAAVLSSGMQLLKENLNRMQINITGLSVAVAGGQGKEAGPSGVAFKRERSSGERDKSFSGANRLLRQGTGAPSVNLLI